MKKPQWITLFAALLVVIIIYRFGKTVPERKIVVAEKHSPNDGHDHGDAQTVTIDTILLLAKKQLDPKQVLRLNLLENSISRGNVKDQQLAVYHQLSRFWADSARIFEPYAWYEAEAARLENSEKSLTFAAHLFLENLQNDEVAARKKWKALQAKDLFERSLKINSGNDSSKIGLGSVYLFGEISANPMEGISKIREVADRDSTNMYAQMTLAKASIISGQYDKAIGRLQTITRNEPGNLEGILLMADVYERMGENENAIAWYRKSLTLVKQPEMKKLIEERIDQLKK